MNRLVLSAVRRWLRLPARRCRIFEERASVSMPDGTRLATQHLWPIGIGDAPVVLMGFGRPDDRIHGPDERFHLKDFHRGMEASARFWAELGQKTEVQPTS